MVQRRIDSLLCTREDAGAKAKTIIDGIKSQAELAKKSIDEGMTAVAQLLEERKKILLSEVSEMATSKIKALETQLASIQKGTCKPAPPEDSDAEPDPSKFLLCTDEVITFQGKLEELQDSIRTFGKFVDTSTYASHSKALGPVIDEAMKIDLSAFVWITAHDLNKVQRKEGGESLSVSFSSPEDFEYRVEDMSDGRYKLHVTPKKEGSYSLRLGIGKVGEDAEDIIGSPFAINVLPPPNYTKIGVDRLGDAGKPWVEDAVSCMRHPQGLCFDRTGRYVIVADQANDRLQVFDVPTKAAVCCFGTKGRKKGDFDTPGYVAVDREDRVFVSDILNHRVQMLLFNPKSKSLWHVRTIGGRGMGNGEFQFPRGIALTERGQLIVCDTGNGRVQVLDMLDDFKYVRSLEGPDAMAPLDAAINREGEILVSDTSNRIHVFDPDGNYSRSFGKKGTKDGMFNYPVSITVDDMNMLFVCDQGNRRMQILSASDGSFKHKWGGWKQQAEGEAEEGEEGASPPVSPEPPDPDAGDEWVGLRGPAGVALNSQGQILVSDYKRHFIFNF